MNDLYEKIALPEGSYDIILDPEIGTMELQEMGIATWLEFNNRDHFAYNQDVERESLAQFILDVADNIGIRGDDTEIFDRMTDKVTRIDIDFDVSEEGFFWVTLFYDSGVGTIHRQGKMEMMITPHTPKLGDRFEYYENRKKIWVQKIAADCQEDYDEGMEMDDFNRYIKKSNLLWLLEDIIGIGYDVWDFLEEINRKIVGK